MTGLLDQRKASVVRRFVPKLVVQRFEERFEERRDMHGVPSSASSTSFQNLTAAEDDISPRARNRAEIKSAIAVVAFFDISGFSALANRFEQLEKEMRFKRKKISNRYNLAVRYSNTALGTGAGAEKLASGLNLTLQVLVDFILKSGGDVIKFAGDALIVVWPGSRESMPATAAVVVECAIRCTQYTLRNEEALNLHTGVGCGQILKCHVGGQFDRWEFIIAGDANTQAALAEAASLKDEVVVSPSTFTQLQKLVKKGVVELACAPVTKDDPQGLFQNKGFHEIRSISLNRNAYRKFPAAVDLESYANLPMSEKVLNLAKAYIPRPVMQLIDSKLATVDELRKVSVIFFKLLETVEIPITELLNEDDEEQICQAEKKECESKMCEEDSQLGVGSCDNHRNRNNGSSVFGGISIDPAEQKAEERDAVARAKKHRKFLDSTQARVRAVQDAAYSEWGTLRQFIIDDKGFVAIVVIGLPPHYFEDNAARAVRVASHLINKSGIQATAGICTGTVFCGAIGSSFRAEYSVTGECINLAARLMGVAKPNTILCDETTTQEARTNPWLKFVAMPPQKLKGYEKHVQAYQPDLSSQDVSNLAASAHQQNVNNMYHNPHTRVGDMGVAGVGPSSAPALFPRAPLDLDFTMLGQEQAKQDIRGSIFSDDARPVKAVFVEGGPGSGKTHITQWAVYSSAEKVSNIFYSSAVESKMDTPFHAWRSILLDILKLNHITDEAVAAQDNNDFISNEDFTSLHNPIARSAAPIATPAAAFSAHQALPGGLTSCSTSITSLSPGVSQQVMAVGSNNSVGGTASASTRLSSSTNKLSGLCNLFKTISSNSNETEVIDQAGMPISTATTTNAFPSPLMRNRACMGTKSLSRSSSSHGKGRQRLSSKSLGTAFFLGSARSKASHGDERGFEDFTAAGRSRILRRLTDSASTNPSTLLLDMTAVSGVSATAAKLLRFPPVFPMPSSSKQQHSQTDTVEGTAFVGEGGSSTCGGGEDTFDGVLPPTIKRHSKSSSVMERSRSMGVCKMLPSKIITGNTSLASGTSPPSASSFQSQQGVSRGAASGVTCTNSLHTGSSGFEDSNAHRSSRAHEDGMSNSTNSPLSNMSNVISESPMHRYGSGMVLSPSNTTQDQMWKIHDLDDADLGKTTKHFSHIHTSSSSTMQMSGQNAGPSTPISKQTTDTRFLQLSAHTGDHRIVEQSLILKRLCNSGRVKRCQLSSLGQIFPGFFFQDEPGTVANVSEMTQSRTRTSSDISDSVVGMLQNLKPSVLLSRLGEIPASSTSSVSSLRKWGSNNMGEASVFSPIDIGPGGMEGLESIPQQQPTVATAQLPPMDTTTTFSTFDACFPSPSTTPMHLRAVTTAANNNVGPVETRVWNNSLLNPSIQLPHLHHAKQAQQQQQSPALILQHRSSNHVQREKEERDELMDLILALLKETGRTGRTLIVFDDAHNMDEDSLELLRRALLVDKLEIQERQLQQLDGQSGRSMGGDESDSSSTSTICDTDNGMASSKITQIQLTGPRVRFLITYRPSTLSETLSPTWRLLLDTISNERMRGDSSANIGVSLSGGSSNSSSFHEENGDDLDTNNLKPPKWVLKTSLQSLSQRDCANCLKIHHGVSVEADLIRFLHMETDGNPGSLVNLFNGLIMQQYITIDPITGMASILDGLNNIPLENVRLLSLPGHFVASVYRKYDNQSRNAQQVLKLACVVGKLVSFDLLLYLYSKKTKLMAIKSITQLNSASTMSSRADFENMKSANNVEVFDTLEEVEAEDDEGNEDNSDEDEQQGDLVVDSKAASLADEAEGESRDLKSLCNSNLGMGLSNNNTFDASSPEVVNVEFLAALVQLEELGFFDIDSTAGSITFRDENERCVIYNMMLNTEKTPIHAFILEWYEAMSRKEMEAEERDATKAKSSFKRSYWFSYSSFTRKRFNYFSEHDLGMEIGMLGMHAMLSEQHLKAFAYFEAGIRISIRITDIKGVECYASSCKEVIDSPSFNREVEDALPKDVHAMFVINLFHSKTFIMMAQFNVLCHAWVEAKNNLTQARNCSNFAKNYTMRKAWVLKRAWTSFTAKITFRSAREARRSEVYHARRFRLKDLNKRCREWSNDDWINEALECNRQAVNLVAKIEHLETTMKRLEANLGRSMTKIC